MNYETIKYLHLVKETSTKKGDWWNNLSQEQKDGIDRGLKDIEEGRTVAHQEVKKRYGL
jgi:predicted transcriptional regulator